MEEEEKSWEQVYDLDGGEVPAVVEEDASAEDVGVEAVAEDVEDGTIAPASDAIPPKYARMIAALEAQGLLDDDAIESHLAQQQSAQAVEGELSQYASTLQARVDEGELSVEAATELYQMRSEVLSAQSQVQVAQQMAQAQAARVQEQLAQVELAKLDPALAQAVQQAGLAPEQIKALADALGGAFAQNGEKSVAKYVAAKSQQGDMKIVGEGGIQGNPNAPIDYRNYSMMDLADMEAKGRR